MMQRSKLNATAPLAARRPADLEAYLRALLSLELPTIAVLIEEHLALSARVRKLETLGALERCGDCQMQMVEAAEEYRRKVKEIDG